MSSPKHHLSRTLYHVIVSIITSACLLGLGLVLLLPARLLNGAGFTILSAFIIFFGLLRAVIAGFLARWSPASVTLALMGRMQGYLVGTFIGFILGSHLGEIAGGIIGAILLFFAGRWAGTRISLGVGTYLTRFFLIDPPEERIPLKTMPTGFKIGLILLYLLPVQLAAGMLLFSYYDVQSRISSEALIILRIVIVVLSVICISVPWFLKSSWIKSSQVGMHSVLWNPHFTVFYLGMIFSIVPAIYGFVVFIVGASLAESLVYVIVSFTAASVWLIREHDMLNPAG